MNSPQVDKPSQACYDAQMLKTRSENTVIFDLLFIVPTVFFYFVFYLGNGSLASWDEAVYAGVAKNILMTGDWLNLVWMGGPWVDKPPLAIWATALAYQAFGISEFSARLVSGLCGAGTVVVLYFLGSSVFGRWAGFLGAMVLASSSHFLRFSRFGMLDAPLTLFLTMALLGIWLGRKNDKWLILSGVFMGLGFLTKSFGALFVIPITWIFCFWTGETAILRKKAYWAGLLAGFLVALPWNVYTAYSQGDGFFKEAFFKHLFLRSTEVVEGHSGNFYFYIRTMINKYHPWILVGILSAPFFLYKSIRTRHPAFVFFTVWMFLYLGVITCMKTKLPWYVLPLYPALSLSVGWSLSRMIPENKARIVKAVFLILMPIHIPLSHLFHHDYSPGIKGLAPAVRAAVPPEESIHFYNFNDHPAGYFYLERKVEYVYSTNDIRTKATEKTFYLLITQKELEAVEPELRRMGFGLAGSHGDARFFASDGKVR